MKDKEVDNNEGSLGQLLLAVSKASLAFEVLATPLSLRRELLDLARSVKKLMYSEQLNVEQEVNIQHLPDLYKKFERLCTNVLGYEDTLDRQWILRNLQLLKKISAQRESKIKDIHHNRCQIEAQYQSVLNNLLHSQKQQLDIGINTEADRAWNATSYLQELQQTITTLNEMEDEVRFLGLCNL
jgi:hypothetical protein